MAQILPQKVSILMTDKFIKREIKLGLNNDSQPLQIYGKLNLI